MKPFLKIKKVALSLLLFSIVFTTLKAQPLSPYLINRELKLAPILKQQLIANRAILKQRNIKFLIGATDQFGQPVASYTGALRPLANKPLGSMLNKKYDFKVLITTSSKTYSLQTENTLPAIRGQRCGTCWDYALVGAAELNYIYKYSKTNADAKNINLSEQQILCYSNAGTCAGGWSSEGAAWLFNNKIKMLSETVLPDKSYSPKLGNEADFCPSTTDSGLYRIVDWGKVPIEKGKNFPEVIEIKKAILEHGAVTAAFFADSLIFAQLISPYAGGDVYTQQEPLFTPPNYKPVTFGHEIVIVGWDDNQGCWIIRNSWGANWGNNGYGLWAYGAHDMGIDATWVELEKVKSLIKIGGPIQIKDPIIVNPKLITTPPPIKRKN
jgi:hypothetical protein